MAKYFKDFEFDSPDELGSGKKMDQLFLSKLDMLRELVGQPLYVLSGFRTPDHNRDVGGQENSAHLRGHAVDLKAITAQLRFKVKHAAYQLGFRRIGAGGTFIHLDDDPTLPQDVEWIYPSEVKRG